MACISSARSYKYHRPRGILSAGSEEPNALVTIDRGGGTHDAEPARDRGRAIRRARRGEPESLAVAGVRPWRGQQPRRAAACRGLLLQDLHGASAARLEPGMDADLRTADPRARPVSARRRCNPIPIATPIASRTAMCWWSAPGRRGSRRRSRRRLAARASSCATSRRSSADRCSANGRPQIDGRTGCDVARRFDAHARRIAARDATAAHDRVRLLRAEFRRPCRADHRSSGGDPDPNVPRERLWQVRARARGARDRRHRAAAGLSRQ